MEDIDIWRTAHLLIKEYGTEASLIAARRIDALMGLGEVDGWQVWKQIYQAVKELERSTPYPGESRHSFGQSITSERSITGLRKSRTDRLRSEMEAGDGSIPPRRMT